MKTYRVAIVGLGRSGSTIDGDVPQNTRPFAIASCCQAMDRLRLVAGSDILPERRTAFREKWGVDAVYEDYREMIESEQPDLVAVTTTATGLPKPGRRAPSRDFREDAHASIGIAAAQAGVAMVFIEKAIACSVAKADQLLAACRENGTVINTGAMRRFDNRFQVARRLIERGEIGEPAGAVFFGDTNLMHGHIHTMDTISYLVGDPGITSVRGELKPQDLRIDDNRLDEDPQATYRINFTNGIEATTVSSGISEYEVSGTSGTIRLMNDGAGLTLRKAKATGDRRPQWEEVQVPSVEPRSSVVSCLNDLLDAHESGRKSLGNIELIHNITEACLAVAESHMQGGVKIQLPLDNRDLYVFHV